MSEQPTFEELERRIRDLERIEPDMRWIADALRKCGQRYQTLLDAGSDVVYCMSPDWREMQFLEGRNLLADTKRPDAAWADKYLHPDDRPDIFPVIETAVRSGGVFELEHRVRRVDGSLGWVFSRAVPLTAAEGGIAEWLGTMRDITAQKRNRDALQASEKHLRRVLDNAEAALDEKNRHLTEVNAALKMLLRQRDEDRREFEDTVTTNLKHLVVPYLERLKKSRLSANQAGWVDIVEAQLNRITSRFARRVTLRELNISNAELRVAALVRDGKTTKEIADILLISEKTVSTHRSSIRRKLGLRGKKGGLRYLLTNLE